MVSRNPRMLENLAIVRRVADTDIPVLVRGESGTGKELVARALHDSSRREAMAFVVINCAAVPETLLEADLFGVRKGTATGVAERKGKFELADGGTMFLDEIGDMSPALQAKLLRVLQDGMVERVGGHTSIKVDVRVVAATNQDLEKRIESGRFRKDLYYRLNAVELTLPPLRELGEDIDDLVKYFVDRFNRELGRKITGAEPEVLDRFRAHPWPGNIRQLEYVVKRAVAVADGTLLRLADLPEEFQQVEPQEGAPRAGRVRQVRDSIERKVAAEVEKRMVHDCLQRAEWNVAEAARFAGYSRVHLYRLMRKHGIRRPKRAKSGQ
jgi:two-component system response regulator AtoC